MRSRRFRLPSAPDSSRPPIRYAFSLVGALLALAASPLTGQDEAVVDELAAVLAAEDARRFDAALFDGAVRAPEAIVRRKAGLALGRIGDERGLPLLLELLVDPDSTVRRDAAFALGLTAARGAVGPLQQEVQSATAGGAVEPGIEAVTALSRIAGPDAAAVIADLIAQSMGPLMGGEEPSLALRAVEESWRLGPDAPITSLTQLAGAPTTSARRAAVFALGRLRAAQGASTFLNAANDQDATVRRYAVRTLTAGFADSAGLERGATAAVVSRPTEDEDPRVRIQALRALGSYRDSTLAGAAADRMADADVNVRVEALAALGQLGGETAARTLAQRSTDQQFAIGREALLGLVRVDRTSGIRKAAAWLTSPDWRRRMVGAESLGILGGDTALTWAEDLLGESDGRIAAQAYAALIERDSVSALDYARELLRNQDPVVRTLAAQQLQGAPTIADIPLLTEAYLRSEGDPIPDAASAIVETLGVLAALGPSQAFAVEEQFLSRVPTCDDYLVRRAAEEHLPAATGRWGPAFPMETGRQLEDYRDIVRRLLLPAEREGRNPALVLETAQGDIVISLFAGDAPLTVNALLELVDRGYFTGHRWHRVVPDFVIQDGDPRGDGWGGPGFSVRDEINRQRYARGTVGMALSGPDTGGSQFFVTVAPQPHLDGTYTVIGTVGEGLEAVDLTTLGDRIRRVRRQ
jgi:cyclophilin family peptidyl-prolyl cis-trans isomerase/HEAT repeat protein